MKVTFGNLKGGGIFFSFFLLMPLPNKQTLTQQIHDRGIKNKEKDRQVIQVCSPA